MGAGTLNVYLHLKSSLLPDAQHIGERAGGLDGRAPAFIDGQRGGKFLRVVLRQPAKPVPAAMFFVRARRQYQAVLEVDAVAPKESHGHHLDGEQTLAVIGSPAVNPAVGKSGAERWKAPLVLVLNWDYVGMGHEHQSGLVRPAFYPGNQVAPARGRLQNLGGYAVLSQPVPGVLANGSLIAGGHGAGVDRRYPNQSLLQFQNLAFGGVYLSE